MDLAVVIGVVASVVTLVGGAAAAVRLFHRPRVSVTARSSGRDSLTVCAEQGRSAPARDVAVGWACLGADDRARRGDGILVVVRAMPWRSTFTVEAFDPRQAHYGSPAREGEHRVEIDGDGGVLVIVSWPSVLPWVRQRRLVVWTQQQRFGGSGPTVLKGRRARREYMRMTGMPVD